MAVYLAKKALREELKQKLKQMSVENKDKQSQAIFMKVSATLVSEKIFLFFYLSITK